METLELQRHFGPPATRRICHPIYRSPYTICPKRQFFFHFLIYLAPSGAKYWIYWDMQGRFLRKTYWARRLCWPAARKLRNSGIQNFETLIFCVDLHLFPLRIRLTSQAWLGAVSESGSASSGSSMPLPPTLPRFYSIPYIKSPKRQFFIHFSVYLAPSGAKYRIYWGMESRFLLKRY